MNIRSLVKKVVPQNLFRDIEPYGHLGEAMLYQIKAGFPAKGLNIIGVTGTDGKTTTSTLITQMLRNSGKKVAMITTISVDYGDGKGEQPNPTRMTTMGAASLIKLLQKVKDNGVDWLVLETTSHALAQHRVWGVPYSVAVMTNIGHEHLDYHRTFERYRDAKRMLFKQTSANRKGLQVGIINADDPSAAFFYRDTTNPILYSVEKTPAQLNKALGLTPNEEILDPNGTLAYASNVKLSPSGSTFDVQLDGQSFNITCHLPGSFNVYNSLAALCVGDAIGLTRKEIEQGIASLGSVEGRMTRVDEGQDFEVIVDYAHTPESFEKLFKEIKPLTKGKLIGVFGSAGRRDEAKRAEQGRIAGKYCDIVIATEEDDRDIDGMEILTQIAGGAEKSGKKRDTNLFLVHKREDAVVKAVKMAKKGDVILLLGKGHEKSILSNGPKAAELRNELQDDTDTRRVIKREYDEVKVARAAIKKR